ncbi:unnamed protein product [Rhodiola kirilowii]
MSSVLSSNDLRRVFQYMDKNGDGVVCLEELNGALEKIMGARFGAKELETVVGKTTLDVEEFVCFYDTILGHRGQGKDDEGDADNDGECDHELVEAFNVFDENGDGFISSEELERALVRLGMWEGKHEDCKSMICVYDLDSDGRLDFHEFKKMMTINKPT